MPEHLLIHHGRVSIEVFFERLVNQRHYIIDVSVGRNTNLYVAISPLSETRNISTNTSGIADLIESHI